MRPRLSKYVSLKLGGVEGELPRLKYMLKKSFTASNFRSFWNAWNPIYSYVLMYFIYKPIRRILPRPLAVVITFIANGLFHDLMVFLILGRSDLVITKLFLVYGLMVVIETVVGLSLTNRKTLVVVLYNLLMLLLPIIVITLL